MAHDVVGLARHDTARGSAVSLPLPFWVCLAAVFVLAERDLLRHIALGIGLCAGMLGIGGLVVGAGLLVWETRLTLQILGEETEHLLRRVRTSAAGRQSK